MKRGAVLALALLLALSTAAEAGEARTRLDRALRSLKDARAPFTQTRTSSIFGSTLKPAPGTLEFRAPRLLRMAFTGTVPTTILVRGDTAWIEQPTAKQVIRTSAGASGAPPLPFLEESVAVLEKSCTVEETGSRTLTLRPRATGAPWSAIDLVLDPVSGLPRRVVIRQHDDEEVRLEFGKWTVNGGIAVSRFAPVFAPGGKVVVL
jgi:outer membrane lipoprotein-sorting protein